MNKQCPVCQGNQQMKLLKTTWKCPRCSTMIITEKNKLLQRECLFCSMSTKDRYFILEFLKTEGTIVKMQKIFGLSYPTIKNRLKTITKQLEGGFVEKEEKDN